MKKALELIFHMRHYKLVHRSQYQNCATYLVNFVKNEYSVFSPKYLGLPVLTKYFVKKNWFVFRGRPPFSLFKPNFGPLLHLQYMT